MSIFPQDTHGIFSYGHFCDSMGILNQKIWVPNPGIFFLDFLRPCYHFMYVLYKVTFLHSTIFHIAHYFCMAFPKGICVVLNRLLVNMKMLWWLYFKGFVSTRYQRSESQLFLCSHP